MDFKVPIINTSIPPSGSYDPDYLVCGIDSSSGGWVYYSYEDLLWYPIPNPLASFRVTVVTEGFTIQNSALYGKLVNAVSIGDAYKIEGFSKSLLSDTATFDDILAVGTILVFYFQQ